MKRAEWIELAWQIKIAGGQIDPDKPPALRLHGRPKEELPDPLTDREKSSLIPWMENMFKGG